VADVSKFGEVYTDTAPDKLSPLSLEQLQKCHAYFVDVNPQLQGWHAMQVQCRDRIELLSKEIESRRSETHSERHHREAIGLGRQTLFWAKVGGIAAAIGTTVLLVSDTGLSKFLRAKASRSQSQWLRNTKMIPETPAPAESPSVSPTPSEASTPE
jgi:hypothetical protein